MCYSAYVSEVFRAGIQSIHPSQGGAALALGLTRAQALRHVILPQAVRRVIPPLLNDFISLQKDVALVSILGVSEAFQVAQVYADQYFNFTPLVAAAAALPVRDDPAHADLRPHAGAVRARAWRRTGAGSAMSSARCCERPRYVTKSYGTHQVLKGIDLTVGEHEAVALIGASGSGKSTLLRCIDLLEEIDDGDIFLDGEPITVPGRIRCRTAGVSGSCSRPTTCSRTCA